MSKFIGSGIIYYVYLPDDDGAELCILCRHMRDDHHMDIYCPRVPNDINIYKLTNFINIENSFLAYYWEKSNDEVL